ncbi:MAG: anaerobic ribonucleoside-triphosphate reductase activating protein [Firmicutes bacterium]|nr:anaerobic ribonucleoside-triphosphate reductase activating protein [Bacillota bacterium]
MNINGIQKLTLLDYPGHLSCTIFSAGCNMRCPFCHNAPLVTSENVPAAMTEDELFAFLSRRRGILDGVVFTGGEPLLQQGIADIMRRVHDMGFLVKLDTNGSFPERLSALYDMGLVDYTAMDIKNSPEKYTLTAGAPVNLEKIRCSVDLIMSRSPDYEFRTTAVRELHTPDDFDKIGRFMRGAKQYFVQQFTDSGNLVGDERFTSPTRAEMQAYLDAAAPYVVSASLRGVRDEG